MSIAVSVILITSALLIAVVVIAKDGPKKP